MTLTYPTIAEARRLSKPHNLDGLIMIAFKDGLIRSVSYGKDKAKCKQLAALLDWLVDEIGDAAEVNLVNLSEFEKDGFAIGNLTTHDAQQELPDTIKQDSEL
jgi:hypothetical protein